MDVVALAGGIGAGNFLRGLQRVAGTNGHRLTVVVNTGDDVEIHGLHVSPDLDSVCYWLSGVMDRQRGWGRSDDTFHATEILRDGFHAEDAWFNLGDRDLATHLFRTRLLRDGLGLSAATAAVAEGLGIQWTILPMSEDPVTTTVEILDESGAARTLHFQEYWVLRRAADRALAVRYLGVERARPAPGVLAAIGEADVIVVCPSNPVASVGPILAVPGVRDALAARCDRVVGISPIVAGAPLTGMADKLMPVAGLEVSAAGAARAYEGLLAAWVVDEADRDLAPKIEEQLAVRVAVAETIMSDDEVAEALAKTALELVS